MPLIILQSLPSSLLSGPKHINRTPNSCLYVYITLWDLRTPRPLRCPWNIFLYNFRETSTWHSLCSSYMYIYSNFSSIMLVKSFWDYIFEKVYRWMTGSCFMLCKRSHSVFCSHTVTERANQARDHILKKDLTGFDGWGTHSDHILGEKNQRRCSDGLNNSISVLTTVTWAVPTGLLSDSTSLKFAQP